MGGVASSTKRRGRAGDQLIDREFELGELVDRLGRARKGDGGTVVVEGAAGIGKTRLLDATCELARQGGFTVLRARASELERGFPFGVVRQLLARTVRADGGGELYAGAAALARTVLEPSSGSAPAPGYPVLHGLYWLVANLAEHEPVVLAVDDLHWADSESLQLMAFLAGRLEGVGALLLLTTRAVGGEEAPNVVTTLSRELHTRVIPLEPLGPEAALRLVASILGGPVAQGLGEACHRAAGGNPFLLRELAAELCKGEGRRTDPASIRSLAPPAIVRAVLARLDRLPQGARALAEATAILGDGIELRQAAAFAGLEADGGPLADALDEAGILAPGRPLRFAHPLLRSAVEGTLRTGELAAAHARAAALMAEEGADSEAVASHLLVTEPGEDDWTLRALREASCAASARAAPASAAAYLRRALRERCGSERRAELLLELGLAAGAAGEADGLRSLREAAALARTPELRVRVAFALAPALAWNGRSAEAADLVNETMESLGDAGEALRELRLLIGVLSVEGRRTTVDEVKRAIPLARELRERAPRLLLVAAAHELAMSVGTAAEANDLADLALRDGNLLNEYPGDSPFLGFAIAPYDLTGRFAEAEWLVGQGIADARARGAAAAAGLLLIQRGCVRMFQGKLDAAESDARQGLKLPREERDFLTPLAVGVLMEVELGRGRIDEAARVAELLPPDLREPGSGPAQVWRMASTELCLAQGRLRDALAHLEAAEAWERDWGGHNGVWCAWRPRAARAYAALGDQEQADALSMTAVDAARRFGAPHFMGVALCARAAVVEEERITLLEEAVEWLRGNDSCLLYAETLAALGAAWRATGDVEAARAALEEALALAQELGAGGVERRALTELVEAGGRPRRAPTAGPASLTPAESETVDLAAQGLKNREIAQAQFVTAKTVETHLSSAYRKLGIRSRAQLAGALAAVEG
ncbi:MAG TPA: AAA family ATPase [Thermoleophilaceae bacterium]|nr:AAA family ATPase [Thermoleophilaceae bacterium]